MKTFINSIKLAVVNENWYGALIIASFLIYAVKSSFPKNQQTKDILNGSTNMYSINMPSEIVTKNVTPYFCLVMIVML